MDNNSGNSNPFPNGIVLNPCSGERILANLRTRYIRDSGFFIFRRSAETRQVEFLVLKKAHCSDEFYTFHPDDDYYCLAHGRHCTDHGDVNFDICAAERASIQETGYDRRDLKVYEECIMGTMIRYQFVPNITTYCLAELVNTTKPVTLSKKHESFEWLSNDDIIICYADYARTANKYIKEHNL